MLELDNARQRLKNLSLENTFKKVIQASKEGVSTEVPLPLYWDLKSFLGLKLQYIPDYKGGSMMIGVATDDFTSGTYTYEKQSLTINLIQGSIIDSVNSKKLQLNTEYIIPKNTPHNFTIKKGSVFLIFYKPAINIE